MTVPPSLPVKAHCQGLEASQAVTRQTVSIRTVSPLSSSSLSLETGATVFVGSGASPGADSVESCARRIPEVQSTNGYARQSTVDQRQQQQPAHVVKIKINPDSDKNGRVISTVRLNLDDNSLKSKDSVVFASATKPVLKELRAQDSEACVRISVRSNGHSSNGDITDTTGQNVIVNVPTITTTTTTTTIDNRNEMHQRPGNSCEPLNTLSNPCFYYNPCQSSLTAMVMSSGQCSPSETLDSGTCSDLDGTPPPLPKKKNSSFKVILDDSTSRQHNRTASLTSSGAEVDDSDDNESNISCDSLNNGNADLENIYNEDDVRGNKRTEVKSIDEELLRRTLTETKKSTSRDEVTSQLDEKNKNNDDDGCEDFADDLKDLSRSEKEVDRHKSVDKRLKGHGVRSKDWQEGGGNGSMTLNESSLPRVTSPDRCSTVSPVVRESTYEERQQERERIEREYAAEDFYANYNRSNGTKYVYDDDRFYKFHVNELSDEKEDGSSPNKGQTDKDNDEYFAGYKILDREAIRSSKGTVRGVKNRVRAGIATFLQKPSSKDYKAKDAGKVVVYTTTSGIIRTSYYNCIKVNQILRTHMAKYEERDLFRSMEHQTELRDRLDCTTIELPQLFIDGQYIGDAETVDRLNESGELRGMLKPYKVETKISFAVCAVCGGFRMLLCEQCNGSKRSVFRNGFTTEFVGLRCMKCNEVGLVPCHLCNT